MDAYNDEEKEIIRRLQGFQPRPGSSAYQRMAQTPWLKAADRKKSLMTLPRAFRVTLTALIMLVVLGLLVWVTPPLYSLAQEIIGSLFNRAADDSQVLEFQAAVTPASPIPASVAQTFASVNLAEAATGIDILQPTIDLSPYTLSGVTVNHEMQTTWLIYNAPGRYLSIYQRAAVLGWLDEGLVGASAEITPVTFENINGDTLHGEYVTGGWQVTAEPTPIGGETVQQPVEWASASAQRKLRWRSGDFVYEMLAYGGNGDIPGSDLMLDEMIALAASMK